MPPVDELDTQLKDELAAKAAEKETTEKAGQEPVPEIKPEEGTKEVKAQEAKHLTKNTSNHYEQKMQDIEDRCGIPSLQYQA